MITEQRSRTGASAPPLPPDFMLPDPPRIPDMQQELQLRGIATALALYFKKRDDVIVAGLGYLRHDATNESERYAPDCVVAFGVDPAAIVARNGYVISEVGKPPDLVIEVASKSTGKRDYTIKRDAYARYRAREYWRSDESGGRWHDAALAGDTLVDGKYVPIEIIQDEDGRFWGYSAVLDLHVCWDDGRTRFYDAKTSRFLPDYIEADDEREESARERDEATRERDEMAIERDRLAAENERLKALLRQAGLDK